MIHGALDHSELAALGIDPAELLDFSSNLNPFGPPAGVAAALVALDPAPYPDRSCRQLRLALAARHGCPLDHILVGNGANELIHLVARALLRPGDAALVVGPTFGEYAHACALAGAPPLELACVAPFQPDVELLCAAIASARPRLTWLCAPNNPTGADLAPAQLAVISAACAAAGGWLLLDQSYAELRRAPPPEDAPAPHVLRLRSLTKSHALAGLRLGYLLAEPALVAHIGAFQPTWSVGTPAQSAGLAALADSAFLPRSLPLLWAASDALRDGLIGLGLPTLRGELPFMLVRCGGGAAARSALLRRGVVVRDCASFGLPEHVRVAPRRPADNARLLAAWEEIL